MVDIFPNGKLKKRIIREGYGDVVPPSSTVFIHYNAYTECADEPFDSTYIRKREQKFTLGNEEVIPGLDIGVSTMKLNEKAQFLIAPDLAFLEMGCLGRVPPNSTVIFEVELKKFLDAGSLTASEKGKESEKKDFDSVYKNCLSLCIVGNDLFKMSNYKAAVRKYNQAIEKMEWAVMADENDQEKQQRLLLRLYTNNAVAYTKLSMPRKACINCNKIYKMVQGTSLQIQPKVYFNNARSLIMLNDLKQAERCLKQALRLKPNCEDIAKELVKLEELKKIQKELDKNFAQCLLKTVTNSTSDSMTISEDFKQVLLDVCKNLMEDEKVFQYTLPEELKQIEIKYIEEEVKKFNLYLKKREVEGKEVFAISKPDITE